MTKVVKSGFIVPSGKPLLTRLYLAIEDVNIPVIEEILPLIPDINARLYCDETLTILGAAATYGWGKRSVLKLLLERGADPMVSQRGDSSFHMPIVYLGQSDLSTGSFLLVATYVTWDYIDNVALDYFKNPGLNYILNWGVEQNTLNSAGLTFLLLYRRNVFKTTLPKDLLRLIYKTITQHHIVGINIK